MTVFLLQATILARNDDTEALVKILIVVIFFAFSIISNFIKNRSEKVSQTKGRPPSRNRSGEHSKSRHSAAGKPSAAELEPGRRIAKDAIPGQAIQSADKQHPRKLREVPLRPGSVDPFSEDLSRKKASASSREPLSGKSRLDRFLEAKLEPKPRTKQHHATEASPSKPRANELPSEISRPGNADGTEASAAVDEQIEEVRPFGLDAENLADAIVYAEILGKPLALRD